MGPCRYSEAQDPARDQELKGSSWTCGADGLPPLCTTTTTTIFGGTAMSPVRAAQNAAGSEADKHST